MRMAIKRALISVSDKTGLIALARGLHQAGVQLLSTGGTATALAQAPRVELQTNFGSIVIELYPDRAPDTVANFLQWGDHLADKASRLVEDLPHDGLVDLGKGGQLRQRSCVRASLPHEKQRLLGLRLVVGHVGNAQARAIRSRP